MSKFSGWVIVACVLIGVLLGVQVFRQSRFNPSQAQVPVQAPVSAALSVPDFGHWRDYTAPTKQFKAAFPALPQHATQKQGDPARSEQRTYDMYVAEADNGSIFMISLISGYPPTKIDASVLSRVMKDMIANSPDNEVKKMEMGTFKNTPAMDFVVENKEAIIEGKAFTQGDTLYVLTMVSKRERYNPAEFQYFKNSFDVLPTQEKKE